MRYKNMIIQGKTGVTLIEVMVVVAIVGFLAAIAIPAYNDYVTRSRRSDAFTALETVRAAQEMYRAEKGFYSGGFANLAGCSATMAGDNYTLSLARTANTAYTATAESEEKQDGDFDFRIDQDGEQEYKPDSGGAGAWTSDKEWEDLR
jgi:type IV pilus assembly protein PilE